jgi:hypothetical protein
MQGGKGSEHVLRAFVVCGRLAELKQGHWLQGWE